jgi:hypothetical protein
MTNFQPDQKTTGLAVITPERALLILPVLASVVLAGAIAGLALLPLGGKLQELDKLEKERVVKKEALPSLVRSKGRLLQQEARAKGQKLKLLQLVAGERSLATLLSQLSVEAANAGVSLESYEPQTTTATPNAPATPAASADPLLGDGVKKDQQLIVVRGGYQGLLTFLRRLEWFKPLLVISDLSLEAQENSTTKLKFTLTAYSR